MSARESESSKSAVAIVGLVVGIIALATSFMPIINNFSFVLGLVGLVFAIVGLVGVLRGRHSGRGLAIASLIINVLALVIVLASQSFYGSALDGAVIDTSDGSAASAAANGSASPSNAGSTSPDGSDKYSIADERLSKDTYSSTIKGTFTNTSGRELSGVSLTYSLFDADGNQVGNAYASTNNLADQSSWKFEAYCDADGSKIASYKLANVTAY